VSTISHGQESIHRAESMLTEKAKLPPLGNDPASVRWKETQKNTSKQSVHSQVSAMNAATAQMVSSNSFTLFVSVKYVVDSIAHFVIKGKEYFKPKDKLCYSTFYHNNSRAILNCFKT
jgi:hypothetical protein